MATTSNAQIIPGTTIGIPSGPTGSHLFVVIFGIKIISGKQRVLLAPIESKRPKCDTSCELKIGDHPFVQHDSFVGYDHCRIEDLDHINHCLSTGYFQIAQPPITQPAVLLRVQKGYSISRRIPKFIKQEWG